MSDGECRMFVLKHGAGEPHVSKSNSAFCLAVYFGHHFCQILNKCYKKAGDLVTDRGVFPVIDNKNICLYKVH